MLGDKVHAVTSMHINLMKSSICIRMNCISSHVATTPTSIIILNCCAESIHLKSFYSMIHLDHTSTSTCISYVLAVTSACALRNMIKLIYTFIVAIDNV